MSDQYLNEAIKLFAVMLLSYAFFFVIMLSFHAIWAVISKGEIALNSVLSAAAFGWLIFLTTLVAQAVRADA